MDAKTQLQEYKQKLDIELNKYLTAKVQEADRISPLTRELMEYIADLTLRGGKRIRAALMYYSYVAHGGKNTDEVLLASMSMELSETYLLIHDDIMDNDSLRRGGMTINTSYRQIGENLYHDKINTRNFGNSMAMLAGNVACALSNELIARSNFDKKDIVRALDELNRVYVVEQYGQMLDVLSQLRENITTKDVLLVHQLKTAPYTFEGPLRIGAILAGADEKSLQKLSDYAIPLGIAFQIQDDILGMFGSEEKLGKPVISDLKEGKKTLLILKALDRATARQREIIEINLGNKKTTMNGLKDVREVINQTKSLDYSKAMAKKLVEEAVSAMNLLKLKKEGSVFLQNIADYMINREY
ncbi:MAG: polyprenyl synthetase family protein [Patescibacteria group bacterium]|jgi:geranylgeranyl diphosphate synthase type I